VSTEVCVPDLFAL